MPRAAPVVLSLLWPPGSPGHPPALGRAVGMRGLQCRGCGRVWRWHPRLEPSRVSRAVLGACCGCGEGMGCGVVTTDVKGSTRLASRICLLPCSGLLAFWNSCTVLCAGHQHCHSWWHCPAGMGTWEVWPSQTGVHFQNTAREPRAVSGGMSVGEGPRLCLDMIMPAQFCCSLG